MADGLIEQRSAAPKVRRAVRIALMTAFVAASAAAQAQQAPASSDQSLQEVVVTGSLIRRTDSETPSPVQVISADEIANSGLTTVNDVLRQLSANGQGNLNQAFSGAFAAGAAGISLRGMTVDATLVLVDGHRMADYPISDDGQRSFVDVANMPMSIVDHIDVLKDGASAVYGSDAIAGVVNIVLKKQFQGLTTTADYGTSDQGDATTVHGAVTYGFGDLGQDGHNTYINFEYRHADPLSLDRRPEYSNFDYADTYGSAAPVAPGVVQPGAAYPFGPNLYGMVGQYVPAAGGNPASATNFQSLPGCPSPSPLGGCPYDMAQYQQIQPQTSNFNALLRHTQNFGGDWQAVFTGSYFESKAEQLNPPASTIGAWASLGGNVNTTDPTAQPILLPIGNVNNPYAGSQAWLAYTFGDVGPEVTQTDARTYRIAADLTGTLLGWDVQASIGATRILDYITYRNYPTVSGLNSVLAANDYYIGVNADENSPSVYGILAPTTNSLASSDLQYLELNVSRAVYTLPGGPLSLGIGIGARHDGQDDPGQPDTITGDVFGLGTTFVHGSETNESIHGEIVAPIFSTLEVDAAGRLDNYAGVGNSTTPKVGFKWKPIEEFMFRGTYAEGFRAPGPGERGNSGVTFFTSEGTDPARCPTTGLPSDCGSGQVAGIVGSNPLLKPETSKSYTLGFVLEPIKQASLSVDWWQIERKNEIAADFGDAFYERGPVQAAYPTLPGPIIALVAPYENLGVDKPTGIDFDLQTKWDLGPGKLGFQATYTHLISQKYCASSDPSSCVDVAGTHGPSGISGDTGTPRDRANATLSWAQGPGETGLELNYVSGYANTDPTIGAGGPGDGGCLNAWWTKCYVASFTDVDWFGRYDVNDKLSINLHILNLFDAKAPFDPQAEYGFKNYDVAFAQQGAIGRFMQIGVKYTLF